jgi:micrococcal nuclease
LYDGGSKLNRHSDHAKKTLRKSSGGKKMLIEKIFEGFVEKVADGDTFTVSVGQQLYVIRLAHLDAPEDGQFFCREARSALSKLIYHKIVELKIIGYDRYSRIIAEARLNSEIDVSAWMLCHGYAWYYDPKKRNEFYGECERAARDARVGQWQRDDLIHPKTWRKNKNVGKGITR